MMAYSKYEYIWKLLSSYNFVFESEIDKNLYCLLCKKIVVEPFAGLCGCQYCGSCIREYVQNGTKYCPGNKKECKEDYLEIGKNVSIDLRSLYNMRKLIANCPNPMCEKKFELEIMSDHMRICGMKTMTCPYANIGCGSEFFESKKLNDHFGDCELNHSKLLSEAIDNLRNDVKEMKKIIEKKDNEVLKIKEHLEKKDIIIEDMRLQMNDILMRAQPSNIFLDSEFICRIDAFSKRKENRRWTGNIFWRYSYKFYLLLWCTGDSLRFKCVIMKGEFDSFLKWPMKHKITLGLVNQDTMNAHLSKKYDYDTFKNKAAFDRPSKEWNDHGIGDENFISVKEIKNTRGLLIHDSIIVSCLVDHY